MTPTQVELDPSLRRLFRGDIQEQGRKLMSMMSFVVGSLTRLEKGLGAAFTKDVDEAWRTAYGVLAATMKEASHAAESTAS